jgi:archaellum component FlaF (FlaF/FlaG flagellin family)
VENSIPALIIGAILIVASSLTARSSLHSYDQLSLSLRAMEERTGEQSQTQLTIVDASLDGANDTLTVELRNDGQTKVGVFDRLDLIVTYLTDGMQSSAWLPHAPGAATAGTWTLESIEDDVFEPGILNQGETAELTVELPAPAKNNRTHRIVISSETGVTASAPFSS